MSLRDAYDELCDLAPDARARRLREMALGDAERARLLAMLSERAGDVFDHPLTQVLQGLQPDAPLFRGLIGRRVGPFTVLELVGEGGSAAVFRADRPAGSGRQEVALKVLRASRLSDDATRRFEREQAILAQLSHPSIARFIEGGVDGSGLPYLAMELVRGTPVTQACAERQLGLRARLRLVSELCRAMQAAHSALVVHCDLKPTNVLLDESGQLKVLDFGIARLVDADGGAEVTRTLALTPEYAAPEQFSPGPPHIAVDVYAIGVLLAEMVTGRRYTAAGRLRPSMAVLQGEDRAPGLPARAQLAKLLQGDVDAIVAKATAQRPEDRYRSADAFGKDIDRYLGGLPIDARKASGWRRAVKFVRRHRAGASLAAAAAASLCALTAVAVVQADRARRAAAVAEEQAARADSVRNLAFEFFSAAEPGAAQHGDVTVAQAVERAIDSLSSDHRTPPRVRIDLLMRLAVTLGRQGRPERAQALLEQLHGESVAAFGEHDPLALAVLERIAKYEIERGAYDSARTHVDALLADPAVAQPDATALRLNALLRSASLRWKTGDYARSLDDNAQALALSRALGDAEATSEALTMRAAALLAAERIGEAIDAYDALMRYFTERYGPVHAQVALAYTGLARAYRRAGRLRESEEAGRAALRIDRAVYPKDHWIVANHLNALTMTLIEQRHFDDALAMSQESLDICRRTLAAGHIDLTTAKYMVGFVLLQMGRYDDALAPLREAFLEHAAALGESASDSLVARAAYGYALVMSGATDAGVRELDAAIDANRQRAKPDRSLLAKALEKRIRVDLAEGHVESAKSRLPSLAQAADAAPAIERRPWCARTQTLRAEVALAERDWAAADDALAAAQREIAAGGCGNEATAFENELLRVVAAARAGTAIAPDDLRALRARASSFAFPPPEIARLTAELRTLLSD